MNCIDKCQMKAQIASRSTFMYLNLQSDDLKCDFFLRRHKQLYNTNSSSYTTGLQLTARARVAKDRSELAFSYQHRVPVEVCPSGSHYLRVRTALPF